MGRTQKNKLCTKGASGYIPASAGFILRKPKQSREGDAFAFYKTLKNEPERGVKLFNPMVCALVQIEIVFKRIGVSITNTSPSSKEEGGLLMQIQIWAVKGRGASITNTNTIMTS